MRIFVGINWSKETIIFLQAWQEKLQQDYGVKGYWQKPNNLHLTLRFLGEVEEDKIPDIKEALDKARYQFTPFDITFKGLGAFPNFESPRILWMGVQSPVLFTFQNVIECILRNLGIPPEYRKYQPHVTLASGRLEGIDKKILRDERTVLKKEKVSTFELMQSVAERGGHAYRSIASYSLKKGDATI